MTKVYKKVTVVLTKELIIGIDEDCLTQEYLEYFSNNFYHVDSPDEIFKTAGDQYARGSETFIEGVGEVMGYKTSGTVKVLEVDEWTDVEVQDCVKG